MKKTIFSLVVSAFALCVCAATSTPEGFTDDLDAAIAASKKSGKTVYAVFSGSDWCYWCKVLDEGYLSKKDFVKEASQNLELVFIDWPKDKSRLSENAQKNNLALLKKYAIRGFPTAMFIAADGTGASDLRGAEIEIVADGKICLMADGARLPVPTEPVTYPIVKVSAAQSAALDSKFVTKCPWTEWWYGTVVKSVSEDDGSVTYSVKYEKKGFVMSIR